MGLKVYKILMRTKLTDNHVSDRIRFHKKRTLDGKRLKNTSIQQQVTFELFHPPNRQNDRICAPDKASAFTLPPVKFSAKLIVGV